MELLFVDRQKREIEFPYEPSDEVAKAALVEHDLEKRFKIFEDELASNPDRKWADFVLKKIRYYLNDTDLRLVAA